MAVTRADVARRAGVSPALVSYVINPGSRPVSAAARRRIEVAIEELGYRPNAIAQALRRSSSRSIGLLVPTLNSPVIASLVDQIEKHLQGLGYVLFTGTTGGSAEAEANYVRRFMARRVDAILLIGASCPDILSTAAATGLPVLALESVKFDIGVSSLVVDAQSGVRAAIHHLVDVHGHTRIACLAGDWRPDSHAEARVAGWREGMEAAGLPHSDDLIVRTKTLDRSGGRTAIHHVHDQTDATAVFIASDIVAAGALDGLRSRHVVVPDDLAMISYDGSALSESTWPRLTTVDQSLSDVSRTAVERVLAKIGKDGQGITHDVLPTRLVIRESCGCTPA